MSSSSSSNPLSANTDPVDVWAGKTTMPARPVVTPPTAAPPIAPSSVGSRLSVGSLLRCQQAADEYERARQERIAAFMQREEQLKEGVEAKLKKEDAQSEAADWKPVVPPQSAAEAQEDVIRWRIQDLEHERESLQRVLSVQGGTRPHVNIVQDPILPVKLATIGVKVKSDKPKPWTGKYDWQEREGWIKSASLYLVSLELDSIARIDELLTPQPFYILRSLFSSEPTHSSASSPQAWFDARNRRSPFASVQDVFQALRSHRADDHAAEVALQRYRGARQGNLRARDFGSSLDALADACINRTIDDLDRRTTFIQGLNPSVQDFVKTQLAARKALGKSEETFEEVVKVAALTDGLASFSSKKTSFSSSAPSSLPSSSRKNTNKQSPQSPQTSKPTISTAASRASNWIDAAVLWQTEHPLHEHSRWSDTKSRPSSKQIRCYKCGEIGMHYSKACTASRKDPKVVVLAALARLSLAPVSFSSSSSPAPDVASENRFEVLPEDEGKGDEM
ncbi:hypothetical protein JCM11641_003507 [Rhodosporidiobolus odoratus]